MNLEKIQTLLTQASKAYYNGEEPILSDDQFDRLEELTNYSKVGYKAEGETAKHLYPLYSLKKFFGTKEELNDAQFEVDIAESPKLDGACVSLLYLDGTLVQMLTRGDGKVGQIITDKATFINNIPIDKISIAGVRQITGEVIASKENINTRNYVSGALSLKDLEEFKTRKLLFVVYDIQPYIFESYKRNLKNLEQYGFKTVLSRDVCFTDYPTDGIVLRVDNNNTYDSLGFTAHHPRGAIAIKERKKAVITTLLDVKWQVGKSGKVTPVAILDPIDINGALVSKATLNNVDFLKSLDLYIGCKVEVIRSGEIIPTIIGRAQ